MQTQLPSNWDKDELVGQLADLCEALLAEGFRWEDVQNAVQVSTCASALALIMTRMSVLHSAGHPFGADERSISAGLAMPECRPCTLAQEVTCKHSSLAQHTYTLHGHDSCTFS